MGQVVVDTSVLVAFARETMGPDMKLIKRDELLLPTVVIAEFKAGLELMPQSKAKNKQIEVFEEVFENSELLNFGIREANQFAIFDALLLSNGRKMSDFDLAIAAHAAVKQAAILTLDKKAKFNLLPGINVRDL